MVVVEIVKSERRRLSVLMQQSNTEGMFPKEAFWINEEILGLG